LAANAPASCAHVVRLFVCQRSRFVEEQVERAVGSGVDQYVDLGAGYRRMWLTTSSRSKSSPSRRPRPGDQGGPHGGLGLRLCPSVSLGPCDGVRGGGVLGREEPGLTLDAGRGHGRDLQSDRGWWAVPAGQVGDHLGRVDAAVVAGGVGPVELR
jgi:hypothetical protein